MFHEYRNYNTLFACFRIVSSTMRLQMKQSFARNMFRFCLLINPVLNTVLLYEMYQNSSEENFTAYVILGAGLMAIWGCMCFSSAGDINRERFDKTLALIFASPAHFLLIVLGKIIGNTLLSLVSLCMSMLTARVLFGIPVKIENPGCFAVALGILIVTFVVVSLVVAALLTLSRKTELYMNMIEIPFILLCGFVYPIEILPRVIQKISMFLAPTHAVELLRLAVWGVEDFSLFGNKVFATLGLIWVYIILTFLLYKRIDKRVRIKATLEVS